MTVRRYGNDSGFILRFSFARGFIITCSCTGGENGRTSKTIDGGSARSTDHIERFTAEVERAGIKVLREIWQVGCTAFEAR